MGGQQFTITERGASMQEAYNTAVEEAEREHGTDPYNGTISTTTGVQDKTRDFKKKKGDAWDYRDDNIDDANKHEPVWGVCISEPVGNPNKIQTQVEVVRKKGAQKWELKYQVSTRGYHNRELVYTGDSQGDAIAKARAYSQKHMCDTFVEMVRVLSSGSNRVANISYKPSPKQKLGEYLFFGTASF